MIDSKPDDEKEQQDALSEPLLLQQQQQHDAHHALAEPSEGEHSITNNNNNHGSSNNATTEHDDEGSNVLVATINKDILVTIPRWMVCCFYNQSSSSDNDGSCDDVPATGSSSSSSSNNNTSDTNNNVQQNSSNRNDDRSSLLNNDNNNPNNNNNSSSNRRSSSRSNNNKSIVLLKMNHNVFLTLLLCVMYGISDSLWSGTVIVAYLKRLGTRSGEEDNNHDEDYGNIIVGNIEAAQGLAGLISALPIGYAADKIGRSKVISAGGLLIIVTSILHFTITQYIGINIDDDDNMTIQLWLLGLVMSLWGVAGGIINGPSQALYADSTPEGERSKYYVYLMACYSLSSCLGPLVSIILFQTIGDVWDLYHLRIIIYVGLCMEIINAFIMMFFDDTKALQEHQNVDNDNDNHHGQNDRNEINSNVDTVLGLSTTETNTTAESDENIENSRKNNNDEVPLLEEGSSPLLLCQQGQNSTTTTTTTGDIVNNNNNSTENDNNSPYHHQRYQKWIPYVIFTQSLIFALASGMTVKFFPLFFKDEVGMSPTQVQIVYVLVPIGMVICSIIAQQLATGSSYIKLGRAQTMLFFRFNGVIGLYSMVLYKQYLDTHPFALVPIYLLRTWFMNCTYPLQESILMDFVPKNERARWKSLDSIAAFGWCGSAAFGGYLSDKYDYTQTFLITAIIQSIGCLCIGCLIPLVPRIEGTTGNDTGR